MIKIYDDNVLLLETEMDRDEVVARLQATPLTLNLSTGMENVPVEVLVSPEFAESLKEAKKVADEDDAFKRFLKLLEEEEEEKEEEEEEENEDEDLDEEIEEEPEEEEEKPKRKVTKETIMLSKAIKDLVEIVRELKGERTKDEKVVYKAWAPYERVERYPEVQDVKKESEGEGLSEFQSKLLERMLNQR